MAITSYAWPGQAVTVVDAGAALAQATDRVGRSGKGLKLVGAGSQAVGANLFFAGPFSQKVRDGRIMAFLSANFTTEAAAYLVAGCQSAAASSAEVSALDIRSNADSYGVMFTTGGALALFRGKVGWGAARTVLRTYSLGVPLHNNGAFVRLRRGNTPEGAVGLAVDFSTDPTVADTDPANFGLLRDDRWVRDVMATVDASASKLDAAGYWFAAAHTTGNAARNGWIDDLYAAAA